MPPKLNIKNNESKRKNVLQAGFHMLTLCESLN